MMLSLPCRRGNHDKCEGEPIGDRNLIQNESGFIQDVNTGMNVFVCQCRCHEQGESARVREPRGPSPNHPVFARGRVNRDDEGDPDMRSVEVDTGDEPWR